MEFKPSAEEQDGDGGGARLGGAVVSAERVRQLKGRAGGGAGDAGKQSKGRSAAAFNLDRFD